MVLFVLSECRVYCMNEQLSATPEWNRDASYLKGIWVSAVPGGVASTGAFAVPIECGGLSWSLSWPRG